jgi:hypothetical protein
MSTQGRREEGRKERTKSLPPPPEKAAQKQWRSLTEEVKYQRKRKRKTSLRREKRANAAKPVTGVSLMACRW